MKAIKSVFGFGKVGVTEPDSYKTIHTEFDRVSKNVPKILKSLRTFCEKSESVSKLQTELGEQLVTCGLQEPEIGEAMIKIGEALKSLATIQHAMLVNQVERFVKPNIKFHKELKTGQQLHKKYKKLLSDYEQQRNLVESMRAKNADPQKLSNAEKVLEKLQEARDRAYEEASEEIDKRVIQKNSEHISSICEIALSFHHFFAEGYTLTNELKPYLEKVQKEAANKKNKWKDESTKRQSIRKNEIQQIRNEERRMSLLIQQQAPQIAQTSTPSEKKVVPKIQPTKKEERSVATVIYDYDTQDEGELPLKEGDIVTILQKNDDGWWLGEIKGRTGYFPCNYVEEESSSQNVTALYDYDAQEGNELSFKEGDVIKILKKNDDGWWLGELNGKQGLLPCSYVQ